MTRAAAVLLAAGSGSRVGAETNKVLLPLAGRCALAWSVLTALEVASVQRIVVVLRPEDRAAVSDAVRPVLGAHDVWLVDGGATRADSEARALDALRADILGGELDVVAIHDAARPLATAELWASTIDRARRVGGAIPVLALPGLLRTDPGTDSDRWVEAPRDLVGVQTPQAFRAGPLLAAYDAARAEGYGGTDTAACLERYTKLRIDGVPGDPANLKVTFAEDLAVAASLLSRR